MKLSLQKGIILVLLNLEIREEWKSPFSNNLHARVSGVRLKAFKRVGPWQINVVNRTQRAVKKAQKRKIKLDLY